MQIYSSKFTNYLYLSQTVIGKSVFSSSVKAEEGPDLLTDIKV